MCHRSPRCCPASWHTRTDVAMKLPRRRSTDYVPTSMCLAHVPLVRDFVRACTTCQRNKTNQLLSAGLLQPLPVPSTVWADIEIDFIKGPPKVNGYSVILSVINIFSKSAHFLPLGHPYTTTTVARVFFDNIVKLHGMPSSIVSDHDPVFTGHFWQELFMVAIVNLQFSSAFHM
jgi:hypothetical protein